MDLFEADCNLSFRSARFSVPAPNDSQFWRRRIIAMLQATFTELHRILVTDGRPFLHTNEANDPNDRIQAGGTRSLFAHCWPVSMITQEQKIGFYREWSSRAARQASSAMQRQTKERCMHSASMWTLIADALEAGDDIKVASLTHNLVILKPNYLAPAI